MINSLSALEAGKVDEIIQKTSEASDKGFEVGVAKGVKAGASRKRQADLQLELVKRRTHFSAFEEWHRAMTAEGAFGTFDVWDTDVRDAMAVGDTLEFTARVDFSPLFLIFTSYLSYVEQLNKPGSVFKASGGELQEAKATAQMVRRWITGKDDARSVAVYFSPAGSVAPRIVGRLDESFVVSSLAEVQGEFTVVAQVDALLAKGEKLSAIRVLADVPPTPLEIQALEDGREHFSGTSEQLGVDLTDEDFVYGYPTVVVRPLAIFK